MVPALVAGAIDQVPEVSVVPAIVALNCVVEQVRTPVGVGVTVTTIGSTPPVPPVAPVPPVSPVPPVAPPPPPFEQAVAMAMTTAPRGGSR